jgi:hypothetical protein
VLVLGENKLRINFIIETQDETIEFIETLLKVE